MSRLRRSFLIVFLSSNGATAVHFIVSIILARLLTPEDIGIFSITVVVTNIAHIFREFGVTSYLKTVKDLNPSTIRAANGVLMTSSWSVGVLLYLSSDWISRYYQQPGIYDVMRILAVGFLFIPFGAITLALLMRDLRVEATTWINVIGVSSYALTAVLLAYFGFGYMSMAWANLINIIATALGCALFRPANTPWLPSFKNWNKVVNFGTGAILGSSVGAINNALPDVMLGKMSSAYDVGILSRSNSTTNIISQIAGPTINYIALPHLATVHNSGKPLGPVLEKAISYLTAVAWPALIATAIFSSEIISLLYGRKWLDCVPIVQILCILSAISILTNFNLTAITAMGRPYLASIPDITLLILRIICLVSLFDGTLISFAWGLVISSLLNYPIHLFIQTRYLSLPIKPILHIVTRSLIITLGCSVLAIFIKSITTENTSPLIAITASLIIISPLWILLLRVTEHQMYSEISPFIKRLWIVIDKRNP